MDFLIPRRHETGRSAPVRGRHRDFYSGSRTLTLPLPDVVHEAVKPGPCCQLVPAHLCCGVDQGGDEPVFFHWSRQPFYVNSTEMGLIEPSDFYSGSRTLTLPLPDVVHEAVKPGPCCQLVPAHLCCGVDQGGDEPVFFHWSRQPLLRQLDRNGVDRTIIHRPGPACTGRTGPTVARAGAGLRR